jgi:hypothetical protein
MSPTKIEALLGKCRNRVHRVGIELEGGWAKLPPNTRLQHDGSVFRRSGPPAGVAAAGELPSPPMPVAKMAEWVKTFHPSHIDASCGLHIHMSFRNALHYQRLMVQEYTEEMVKGLKKWAKEKKFPDTHPLWPRLEGQNEFCSLDFYADQQVKTRSKNYRHEAGGRYTFINYCFGLHNTLECRGLCMFDKAEVSVEALQRIVDLTNAFLVLQAHREPIHQEVIEIDLGSSYERFQEYV